MNHRTNKRTLLRVLIIIGICIGALLAVILRLQKIEKNPYSTSSMEKAFAENEEHFNAIVKMLYPLVMDASVKGERRSISVSTPDQFIQEKTDQSREQGLVVTPIQFAIQEETEREILQTAAPLFEHAKLECIDAHDDQICFFFRSYLGMEWLIVYREDGGTPHGVFFNILQNNQIRENWFAVIDSD